MSVRSAQAITTEFTTRVWATGAAGDATGTPTGTLFVNGTSNAASVTVTNQATGRYKAAVTLPTLAIGDVVSIIITATVSGVTDSAKVWEDTCDVLLNSSGQTTDANSHTAAQTATAVWQDTTAGDFTVASSIGKCLYIANVVPGAAGGHFIAGVNAATTVGGTAISVLAAGAQMDLVNAPNATALLAIANKVEAEIIDETDSEKVLTAITDKIAAVNPSLAGLTIAAIATGVRTNLATELGRIDVATSTRMATFTYTAPLDAAGVRTAVGLASANLDTQLTAIDDFLDTEIALILNRLGAFTGSGVNTVYGVLRAIVRSDLAAPSDIGGTFDPATDSTQAIRDNMSGAGLDAAGVRAAIGMASADLDAQIDALALGEANITITPVAANSSNPRYSTRAMANIGQGSAPTDIWVFVDAMGAPIVLTGKIIRLTFAIITDEGEDEHDVVDDTLVGAFEYETGGNGLTVGGTSGNQVTLVHDALKTAIPGKYSFFWWNVTDELLLCKGTVEIEPTVFDV